jgi:hypothetical protein
MVALSPNDVDYFYIRRDDVVRLSSYLQDGKELFDIKANVPYKSPITGDYYLRVTPKRHVKIDKPDCLMFAEGLCLNDPTYKKPASQFRVRDTDDKRLFGVSDDQNVSLSKLVAKNIDNKYHIKQYADPEEGEAFAIVRQGLSDYEELAPYHIAFVILKDGRDCVTIEVDAGDPDRRRPIFDIYSITPRTGHASHISFHDKFKEDYSLDRIKPITIVLQYKKAK